MNASILGFAAILSLTMLLTGMALLFLTLESMTFEKLRETTTKLRRVDVDIDSR